MKLLRLLPDDTHVTTQIVADYFDMPLKAVYSLVADHRAEMEASGYQVLTGERLTALKAVCGIQSRGRSLALFSRRTVLNVAMLLRDSDVARQVRSYLLDAEQDHRTRPVDNSVHRHPGAIDALVADIAEEVSVRVIGRAVVPLFNGVIERLGSIDSRLESLDGRVARLEELGRPRP